MVSIRKNLAIFALLCAGAATWAAPGAGPAAAQADDSSPRLRLGGYVQLWYLNEQAKNGKLEDGTGDLGAQIASGFAINRARLQLGMEMGCLGASMQVRMEGGSLNLLDAYGSWGIFGPAMVLRFGQMKVPSAWEVRVPDEGLDFVTRSRFASEVVNWSLSKSTFSICPLYNVQTYSRDTGLSIEGEAAGFRYALMAGNGLGANNYVGADESRGFVYANAYGAYFYGARASYDVLTELRRMLSTLPASLELGGHYNWNDHPNLIYSDAKTVLDLKRRSWSADLSLRVWDRLRVSGMYGEGVIDDDYDHDGATDYSYRGWEIRAMAVILPGALEAGARYDSYAWNRAVTSGWTDAGALTVGVTWSVPPALRMQLNYKLKIVSGDLASNDSSSLVMLAAQVRLDN